MNFWKGRYSLLYVISVFEKFHRKLFLDSGGNLYLISISFSFTHLCIKSKLTIFRQSHTFLQILNTFHFFSFTPDFILGGGQGHKALVCISALPTWPQMYSFELNNIRFRQNFEGTQLNSLIFIRKLGPRKIR